LLTKGQTIGKKALKIKVVTTEGELPPAFPHFAKRYAVFYGLGYIPYVGNLLSFINLALIFDKRKLAGHDRFAGTKVVEN
jgi:uncharacterized RDD family membrane protein YckC